MENQRDLNESLPLPIDEMPECWEKDDRMNSLFAQFRNRSVNPQDWDSKYRFWRGMISHWCKHNMRCSFSLSDLNKAFRRNGRTPACLDVVLRELHRNQEIVPLTDFVHESPSSWGGWAINTLVKKPILWSFTVLKNTIVEPSVDPQMKYVQMDTVKELGDTILSTVEKNEENTLQTLSDLATNCVKRTKGKCMSDEDMKLALIWLRHNKKAAFRLCPVGDDRGMLLKLSNAGVQEVSEVEEGLYNLEKQEEMLIKNLEMMELEKEAVVKNAKAYLANGMRQVAKSCLRKKKELERSIEKRATALQNIQIIVARVKDAHSDSQVLNSYKTGTAALKKKLDEDGLTEDSVTETMNDLSEVLEEFSEMQSVLSRSVDVYDSELENELSELLAESLELDDSVKIAKSTAVEKPESDVDVHGNEKPPDIAKELSSLRLKDLPCPKKYSPPIESPVALLGD